MVLESRDPRDLCGKGPAGSRLHPTYPRTSAPQSPDLAEAETEEVMSPGDPLGAQKVRGAWHFSKPALWGQSLGLARGPH